MAAPPHREDRLPPEDLRGALESLGGSPAEGRLGQLRQRLLSWAERISTWGPTGPIAEVAWQVFRRDQAIAGSVLAAAVAYRLFVWLLPLSLLVVGGLGAVASGRGEPAADYAEDAGIGDVFADSIGAAADAPGPIGRALLIGTASVVLLYETYLLLRAFRTVSAFAWRVPLTPMRRPAERALMLLGLLVATAATAALTNRLADLLGAPLGWVLALASLAILPAFYVILSTVLLPSGATRWTDHLPGAALFYLAMAGIHLFNSLILFPWISRKEETYGVLGVAAGILLSLFIFGRAMELCAALNAVLHERRAARARA
jgi:uncharacterized BrkB/YihY/UPF0761 family membrane protein